MPIFRLHIFIYILFSIYFSISCINCQSVSFSDNFNNGIDPAIWQTEGTWAIAADNQSMRSDVKCREYGNISLKKKFVGPCRVSFSWKISSGHNKVTLYDNDNKTLYKLPSDFEYSPQHECIGWTEVAFNLSDRLEHNFKWVHENPFEYVIENPNDIGKIWLDNIQINSSIPPNFRNFIDPTEAIYLSDSISDVISNSTIASLFNYSVESSSENLTLFILPPNSSTPLDPFLPNIINQTTQDMYKFEWINLKLDCKDIGDYYYWFTTDKGYSSPRKSHPRIIALVKEAKGYNYNFNQTSKIYTTRYEIQIISSKNWTISLIGPDRSQLDDAQKYVAGTGLKKFIWDHEWTNSEVKPTLKFNLV
jgi:hypothetical protein